MNASRLTQFAIRATMLGALLAGSAGAAMAQSAKPVHDRKAEKSAVTAAKEEPKTLLKGIVFTDMERKAIRDIEKRYGEQFRALDDEHKAAEKAGSSGSYCISKIEAMKLQERAEIRSVLTAEQQKTFDANVAALGGA